MIQLGSHSRALLVVEKMISDFFMRFPAHQKIPSAHFNISCGIFGIYFPFIFLQSFEHGISSVLFHIFFTFPSRHRQKKKLSVHFRATYCRRRGRPGILARIFPSTFMLSLRRAKEKPLSLSAALLEAHLQCAHGSSAIYFHK